MSGAETRIVPYGACARVEGLGRQLDAIFFGASETKSFASEKARLAFRERWLGRYLDHYPANAWLAVGRDGPVAGYLVGSLEDPAATSLFNDIAYFKVFSHLTIRFPAHLHVNLAPEFRGQGIGSRLIEAFARHAEAAGAAGVHVVTGKGMRNVGFYERNGFALVGEAAVDGRMLVLLGRHLRS
jgi:ribosomal protein S18 acetylase RimI-like enzyme